MHEALMKGGLSWPCRCDLRVVSHRCLGSLNDPATTEDKGHNAREGVNKSQNK